MRQVLVAARGIIVEVCGSLVAAGRLLWRAGFSLVVARRLQGMWLCSLQHAGSLAEARELSSCGSWAQLSLGTWDPSSQTRD